MRTYKGIFGQLLRNGDEFVDSASGNRNAPIAGCRLFLASGQRADDEKRFGAADHLVGKAGIRGLMREVFCTRKEPDERAPPVRDVIANRAAQHWIIRFERVEHGPERRLPIDLDLHFRSDARKRLQMLWKDYSDHLHK
jgi:hypothetical protein